MMDKLNKLLESLKPMVDQTLSRFKHLISKLLRKWDRQLTPEQEVLLLEKQTAFALASKKNPYLQSRALWNDVYGSVYERLERAHRIIYILMGVIVIAMLGFVIVAGETKVKSIPFVIHGNEVLTADNLSSYDVSTLKQPLALYFLKNFIRDARTVSVDGDVNAEHTIAAYSFVADAAVPILKAFYAKNDPDQIASHYVKSIHITSVLRESPQTVDIRWREDWRDINSGTLLRSRHYIAEMTYDYATPSQDALVLQHNPLGLRIRTLSWSLDDNNG